MKWWFLSILFLAIIVANTSSTIAQDKAEPGVKDFSSLINQIFAPVTNKSDFCASHRQTESYPGATVPDRRDNY